MGKAEGSVRKGYVPVMVGENAEEMHKFQLQIDLLKHPSIGSLLEMSAREFGYGHGGGVIVIPCPVDHFRRVLDFVLQSATNS